MLNLFLKYFFTHDPVENIYLLRHNNEILNVAQLKLTKAPIETSMTQPHCFFIGRNNLPCKSKEEHTTILTTCSQIGTIQATIEGKEYRSSEINIG